MSYRFRWAALIAALMIAGSATAQETTTEETPETPTETPEETPTETPDETPAEEAPDGLGRSMGEEVQDGPQPGQTYVLEVSGDWEIRCVRLEEGEGNDPCQMYQLLTDDQGNSVAEMTVIPLPEEQQAAAGANFIAPLETLLTQQMTMSIDGGQARRYPFTLCSQVGCLVRLGLSDADLTAMQRGNAALITIVPAAAPDQRVDLSLSLTGFTAAFRTVTENNLSPE